MVRRVLGRTLSYEQAREVAADEDPAVRRELASRRDVVPEILYYLAEDTDPSVRRTIAENLATPAKAHMVLVSDQDEEVRARLASRIARLAPGLSTDDQDRVRRITYQVLDHLARDQAVRVRQIVSETLKDVADAPPEVILRLARDVEAVVSTPILEFSPVLSDEDLVGIIESVAVTPAALTAISRRGRVAEQVSDAIVFTDDEDAIAALLANPSAQIREDTLDRLVERAPDRQSWHAPLVHRPTLTGRVAIRLARFVADSLLDVLTRRHDLDPILLEEVSRVVRSRLEEEALRQQAEPLPPPERNLPNLWATEEDETETEDEAASWRREVIEAYENAKVLLARGALTEKELSGALKTGEEMFVAVGLAVLAGVAPAMVMAILDSRSAKGILALTWKAGLSAAFAAKLQVTLAQIAPAAVLRPTEDGGYPLEESDMEWQLEMFEEHNVAQP
ncbi:MAG: DUF2336 domain-containing protein [Alphaproteobacteria bacterium]